MDCLFCKIIAKKIPALIEFENDRVLAFNDINPQAPSHLLVVPKQHLASVNDLTDPGLLSDLFSALRNLAKRKGLTESGYRVVVNHGQEGGQAVDHLHFHLLGGRQMTWPPG